MVLLSIFSIILIILHLCDATLIVAYFKINAEYASKLKRGFDGLDPLSTFGLRSRQVLCDTVIRAKIYTSLFSPRTREDSITLIPPAMTIEELHSTNYQRSNSTYFVEDLLYKLYSINVRQSSWYTNAFPCVSASKVILYVSFGLVDKFMYLFEPYKNIRRPVIRVTAIIEPTPLIKQHETHDQLTEYFWSHFQSSHSFVCNLSSIDHSRLCSSAFEVLVTKEYLHADHKHVNRIRIYRKSGHHKCKMKYIYPHSHAIAVLPCSLNNNGSTPQFYVLDDPQTPNSIFVFVTTGPTQFKGKWIYLVARIEKIGALLNPFEQIGQSRR